MTGGIFPMKKTVFLALAVFLLFLCSCRQQPEMTETLTGENTAGTTAEEKETKEKEPLERHPKAKLQTTNRKSPKNSLTFRE